LKVYGYNIIMILIGPERRGREMRVEHDDETMGVVGKIIAEDVIGDIEVRTETIEEKATNTRTEAV